ncbi:MAG: class I SAM-dependent methyltransferase [Dehalococcoidia bacterium]|nr:class I SAM-dependent methyltransferase [Dehalococcoidia bacterium]
MSQSERQCPLCLSTGAALFHTSTQKNLERDYHHCDTCDLVFVPPKFHLDPDDARERYLTHDNDPDNPDYRRFLSRLWDELRPRLPQGARGLDYGAGPGPALAAMIEEDGHSAALYDPLFHPDDTVLARTYDFITCTETVEHFATPRADFLRLNELLAPGAYLGIMTDILEDIRKFPDWYYHRDPTHLAFYTRRTLHWIANWLGLELEHPRPRVVLLHKRGRGD